MARAARTSLASQSGHLRFGAAAPLRSSADLAPGDAVRAGAGRQMILTASALFRPRHWPDSSAFRPLHSLPHSASPTSLDALAHSDGRKLPRPARTAVLPKTQDAEGRDAPHVAQDKTTGIAVSPPSFRWRETGRTH